MLCPTCYHEIPGGGPGCPFCRASYGKAPAVPPLPADGPRRGCAWERREGAGAFAAFGETLQGCLFRPVDFFRQVDPAGKAGTALLYAVIAGTIADAVAMLWMRVQDASFTIQSHTWNLSSFGERYWFAAVALLPLWVLLFTLLSSGLLHFSLLVCGGAKKGYGATLKAVSYSASASTFKVFPYCGTPIALLWRPALVVIGLRELHGISTGRAVMALLLPLVFACAAAVLLGVGVTWGLLHFMPSMGGLLEV